MDAGTILAHIDMDAEGFMGALDGAAERLNAFAQGELPEAIAAATGVLETEMNAETGEAVSAAWMQGVCAGVEAERGALEGGVGEAASAAVGAAATEMDEAAGEAIGAALMAGMDAGVEGGAAGLAESARSAAGEAASAAAGEMSAGRGHEIGAAMVAGMAQGVRAGAGGLYAAVSSVAGQAVRRAKASLEINSPSAVFADEVGAWIPSGIGEGIRAHADDAIGEIEQMRRGLVGAMDGWELPSAGVRGAASEMSGGAWSGGGERVRIEVTGDWSVRSEKDRDEIIEALSERIGEELRRR